MKIQTILTYDVELDKLDELGDELQKLKLKYNMSMESKAISST